MFDNISACVFDAYGTLFDVHSAALEHAARLGPQSQSVSAVWRQRQLEYTWLRSLMGRHCDFMQITADGLDYALDAHGIDDASLRDDLLYSYLKLDCYPEVPRVLRSLRDAGMKTAILSNGTPGMLAAAVHNAGIGDLLDAVLSVEEVGIYKPAPRVYALAVQKLGIATQRISFQSSNAWDAAGGAAFGFQVAWVNRFDQRRERIPQAPHAEMRTLEELPRLLGISE